MNRTSWFTQLSLLNDATTKTRIIKCKKLYFYVFGVKAVMMFPASSQMPRVFGKESGVKLSGVKLVASGCSVLV